MNEPVFYERSDGQWAWRVVAANGEVVGNDGGQGFRDDSDAHRAFEAFLQGLLDNPGVLMGVVVVPQAVRAARAEGSGAEETTAPPES